MGVNFQFLDLTDSHDGPVWYLSIEISTVSVKTGPILSKLGPREPPLGPKSRKLQLSIRKVLFVL